MTKKCLQSFLTVAVFSAGMLVSMYLMLLLDVNKYVGVLTGLALMIFNLCLSIAFGKKPMFPIYTLIANAIACGIASSSLYVHLGWTPKIWQSLAIWATLSAIFAVYCILTNLNFIKRFPKTCIAIFLCALLAIGITGECLSDFPFSLALLVYIPFASLLITILIKAENTQTHFHHISIASFAALILVIIIVLIAISDGDGIDGIDGMDVSPDTAAGSSNKKERRPNPYDFNNLDLQ